MIEVNLKQLELAVLSYLTGKLKYPEHEARTIADCLLYAELRGNSQGLDKLALGPPAGIPERPKNATCTYAKNGNLIVAENGFHSMVAVQKAVDICNGQLQDGKAIVGIGITGTNSSSGALGFFTSQIAQQGNIAILLGATPKLVSFPGSKDRVLGTNPISFALPAIDNRLCIVFDSSTSETSFVACVKAKNAGEKLSGPFGINSSGEKTDNPDEIVTGGALLPAGKLGAGIGLLNQFIATMLGDQIWGHFLIGINPEQFSLIPKGVLVQHFMDLERSISTSSKAGEEEIRMPGENGNYQASLAIASNKISISEAVHALLFKS